MGDLDQDIVRDFIISRGGKIRNNDLVSHFKNFLNDPRYKDTNRVKFKQIVNTIAIVKLETTGEKMLVLKKKYRGDSTTSEATPHKETPIKYPAPKAKLRAEFVPRTPSVDDNGVEEAANADDEQANGSQDNSLLAEIQKELTSAGLKDESSTDPVPPAEPVAAKDAEAEEVFVDALSQQPSPEDAAGDTPNVAPKQEEERFESVSETFPGEDKPDGSNKVAPAADPHPVEQLEPEVTEETVTRSEPFQTYQEPKQVEPVKETTPSKEDKKEESKVPEVKPETVKQETVPQRKNSSASDAASDQTSSEVSKERDVPLTTPARAPSQESIGPKEPPISVKDRAKHLNKISSQSDLQSVKQAPEKLLRRSEGREGSEDSDSLHISLNAAEREWMIQAAKSEYHALHKLLLKNPYLAKRKDFTSGYTALHWACKHGNSDVVKMLCGTQGVHVNAKSNGGYTPLHLAAMQGHEEIIEILVSVYGADTNIRDYNGKKAKQYLKNSASSRCQQLLQARRGSMVQAAGNQGFKRKGSYSSKIGQAGHFNMKVPSSVRASWMPQSISAGSLSGSQSRSPSPSPKSSPASSRKSASSLRDEDLMPPPQEIPARRRRNKRGSKPDAINASDQELNRADSDPSISLQQQGVRMPQSVSYTSVV